MGSNRLTKRVKIQQTSSIALHLTEVQVFDEAVSIAFVPTHFLVLQS